MTQEIQKLIDEAFTDLAAAVETMERKDLPVTQCLLHILLALQALQVKMEDQ